MKTVLFRLIVLVVCSYCHVDFKSIGRHAWRCKEKLNIRKRVNERNEEPTLIDRCSVQETHDPDEAVLRNQGRISNVDHVQCCCGKKCKGLRGLKTHQRSCRFVKGMNNELLFEESEVNNLDDDLSVELDGLISNDTPGLKPGVKWPKNESQWREADFYFRAELPVCDVNEKSINECVIRMSNLVYDYFAENFGTVNKKNSHDDEFDKKCANYTKQELKRELKALKHQSITDVNKIRYVSKLLRNLSSKKGSTSGLNSLNDDEEIKKNFDFGKKLLPTFNLSS
jgi:hypothetical protein